MSTPRRTTPQAPDRAPLRRLPALAAALLLAGSGAGCDDGFLPPSYLDGLRVLAVVADPPEVAAGERATLTPHVYLPEGQRLTESRWSFCPLTLGAATGFACALDSCQVELTPGADGAVVVDPAALAGGCAAKLAGTSLPGGASALVGGALPQQIEAAITLAVASSDGERRSAVARLPVWTRDPPAARNRSPVIQRVELDGVTVGAAGAGGGLVTTASAPPLAPAQPEEERVLRVLVDPASMDAFTDASGRARTEEPIISVFATAGRFAYDREAGLDVSITWRAEQLEPGQTEAQIYVVARDLRGGQAVAGPFVIPLSR